MKDLLLADHLVTHITCAHNFSWLTYTFLKTSVLIYSFTQNFGLKLSFT